MSDLLLDYYNALQQATNLQSKPDRIASAIGPRDDLSEVCWCGDCEEKQSRTRRPIAVICAATRANRRSWIVSVTSIAAPTRPAQVARMGL